MGLALALSPLIANAENVVKLLMKDKTTEIKQDETDDKEKSNNQDHNKHGYGCTVEGVGDKKFVCGIGGMSGFRSTFLHSLEHDTCIVILSNFGFVDTEKIAYDIVVILESAEQ